MPTITLTLPTAGTDITSGLHATNYLALQTLLNGGLDGANFVNASLTLGSSFALNIGGDTNLYRSAANYLKTDDSFATGLELRVGTDVVVNLDNVGKIYFGSALDTNLYRSAANQLKTDDSFFALNFNATAAAAILSWTQSAATQSTVGAAGGASALPANPRGYLKFVDHGGTTVVVPYYAAA